MKILNDITCNKFKYYSIQSNWFNQYSIEFIFNWIELKHIEWKSYPMELDSKFENWKDTFPLHSKWIPSGNLFW
jgi:hypothetical protein